MSPADQPSSSSGPTQKGRQLLADSVRNWPHWPVAFTVAVMLGSLGLFVRYLVKNVGVSYYDENYYVFVAERILNHGLFGFQDDLRTYLYPLLIAFAKLLFGASPASKALVCVFQYAVFLYSLRLVAATSVKLTGNRAAGHLVFAAGALNPYLVQATTLFLTDILAACLVACGFNKLLFGDLRLRKNRLLATLPFAAAVMVRPASLLFIPIALLGLAVRRYVEPIRLPKSLLSFALSLAVFVPQLYMNVTKFNHWTPIIHVPLYTAQTHGAMRCLKLVGVVIPGEPPPLCFANPWEDNSCHSLLEFAMKSPLAFSRSAAAHMFAALDWGRVDTYITDYYARSRFPASFLLQTAWFLIALGFIRFLRHRRELPSGTRALLLFLAAAIVADLGFLATVMVESRYGYPVFLMALPFLGFSLSGGWPSRKATAAIAASWLLWLVLSTALSLWMEGTSGRIHWLAWWKG